MIESLNRMNSQTSAFLLILCGAIFATGGVVAAIFLGQHEAVWSSLFNLASACVSGAFVMLKASSKEVNLTNESGSNVESQTVSSETK